MSVITSIVMNYYELLPLEITTTILFELDCYSYVEFHLTCKDLKKKFYSNHNYTLEYVFKHLEKNLKILKLSPRADAWKEIARTSSLKTAFTLALKCEEWLVNEFQNFGEHSSPCETLQYDMGLVDDFMINICNNLTNSKGSCILNLAYLIVRESYGWHLFLETDCSESYFPFKYGCIIITDETVFAVKC